MKKQALPRFHIWVLVFAKVLISVGLIAYISNHVDWTDVGARFVTIDRTFFTMTLCLMVVQVFSLAHRWQMLLIDVSRGLSYGWSVSITMVSLFFNQFIPAGVGGPTARVWYAARRGIRLQDATTSVILERLLQVIGLAVIMAITLPLFMVRATDGNFAPAALMLLVIYPLSVIGLVCVNKLPEAALHWRPVKIVSDMAAPMRGILLSPVALMKHILFSIVNHLIVIASMWTLTFSFGVSITWLDALALFPPVMLISILPISIIGWGVREVALVGLFGYLGVSAESALTISIMFGFSIILSRLPGAVIWMLPQFKAGMPPPPQPVK